MRAPSNLVSRFPLRAPALLALLLCAALLGAGPAWAKRSERPEKRGILLAAFGVSMPEAESAFVAIEKKVREAFPGVEIRWAYTSKMIRHKLAKEQNKHVDSPAEALARMMDEDFTHVAVQSLQTIPGAEFHDLQSTVAAFSGLPKGMAKVVLGAPLLQSTADVETVAKALLASVPTERKADEAAIFVGHGTHHPANIYYAGLQYALWKLDRNILVGTVEGTPTVEDVLAELKRAKIKKAYLLPFLAVAGDHAHNDMAGNEADSWKSALAKAGVASVPVLKGTGESDAVAAIWVDHLKAAMEQLNAAK